MTTVADILTFLETIAPVSRKMDWDNTGFQCGSKNKIVRKILVALDPFEAVATEAAEISADMIVTHHPILFRPAYSVTDETSIGRTLLLLAKHDIAVYSAHTNLDIAPTGVNNVLAKALGLKDIFILDSEEPDADGKQWGLLRVGNVDMQSTEAFLSHVKEILHTPVLRYCEGGKPVHKVAVGGGACADEVALVAEAGCDTFVTSDAKYNDFWDAHDLGVTLIDAGHFYTENPICSYIATLLRASFPEIEVVISQNHRDCMKFF